MSMKGKHLFGEIEGQRVSFVEKKIDKARADFLKDLLEFNGFEVIVQEERRRKEEDPQLYTVAVTDMTFNPVIFVYQRRLKTKDGRKVTQDFWLQKTEKTEPNYWDLSKKDA